MNSVRVSRRGFAWHGGPLFGGGGGISILIRERYARYISRMTQTVLHRWATALMIHMYSYLLSQRGIWSATQSSHACFLVQRTAQNACQSTTITQTTHAFPFSYKPLSAARTALREINNPISTPTRRSKVRQTSRPHRGALQLIAIEYHLHTTALSNQREA